MKRLCLVTLLLVAATTATVCGASEPAELTPVTFMLDWVPNTNHTGIFVAKTNGYFEDAGLNVTIIQPGEVYPEAAVGSGAADFGITFQESLTLARAEDVPVVSIAAVLQHNTSGFASAAALNVTSPADWEGLRYGAWGSPFEEPTLEVLMGCAGADFSKLEIVNTGWSDPLALIAEKQIDISTQRSPRAPPDPSHRRPAPSQRSARRGPVSPRRSRADSRQTGRLGSRPNREGP